MQTNTFHQFSIQQLNSDDVINFSDFKGKKILLVNVASECGYTPQYEDLQQFHKQYGNKVAVIGFPCNQFGGQEPGTELQIQQFCKANFGVTFPMTTKIDVKGNNQHPIYQWLTQKELNGKDNFRVSWNFNKFLIDEDGNLIDHFGSGVNPFDDKILDKI
jgi:glutathione peroxidase